MTAPTLEASTTSSSALATAARSAQVAISAQAMRDAVQLWPLLDPKRLPETWPAWLRAMVLLTKTYHSQSSLAAGRFYRQLREHATQSPAPSSLLRVAQAPSDEWLTRAFGFSGPGMLSRDTARPNTALSTTLGTASRIVQDGGRTTTLDTVHEDPVAVGWYRLTDGQPCPFCALLASRGLVYKSEKSASFEAHNQCGCIGVPAFSRDHELPDINQQARAVYYDTVRGMKGPKTQATVLPAFRKAWAAHQA